MVREEYRLNHPLLPLRGITVGSLAHTTNTAVVIETVKPAEAGEGTVLRLYESLGAPAQTALHTTLPHARAFETDLLENRLAPVDLSNLAFGSFEIKTLLLEG